MNSPITITAAKDVRWHSRQSWRTRLSIKYLLPADTVDLFDASTGIVLATASVGTGGNTERLLYWDFVSITPLALC